MLIIDQSIYRQVFDKYSSIMCKVIVNDPVKICKYYVYICTYYFFSRAKVKIMFKLSQFGICGYASKTMTTAVAKYSYMSLFCHVLNYFLSSFQRLFRGGGDLLIYVIDYSPKRGQPMPTFMNISGSISDRNFRKNI